MGQRRGPLLSWSRAADLADSIKATVERRVRVLFFRLPRFAQHAWLLIERTGRHTHEDRVLGLSAEVALFTLISLPALLIAVLGSLGFIAEALGPAGTAELHRLVFDVPESFMSERTFAGYRQIVGDVLAQRHGSVVSIGILLSVWTGSRAVNRYLDTITIAYGVEPRPMWRRRLLAFGLTIGGLVAAVAVLPPLVVGPPAVRWLTPDSVEQATLRTIDALFWPGLTMVVLAGLATLYHLGVPWKTPWLRDLPGAVLALAIWLLASAGLRAYIDASLQDITVFRQLAFPIAVVLWLYATAFAVLVGAELNSEIEKMWPHERHPWRLRRVDRRSGES